MHFLSIENWEWVLQDFVIYMCVNYIIHSVLIVIMCDHFASDPFCSSVFSVRSGVASFSYWLCWGSLSFCLFPFTDMHVVGSEICITLSLGHLWTLFRLSLTDCKYEENLQRDDPIVCAAVGGKEHSLFICYLCLIYPIFFDV